MKDLFTERIHVLTGVVVALGILGALIAGLLLFADFRREIIAGLLLEFGAVTQWLFGQRGARRANGQTPV